MLPRIEKLSLFSFIFSCFLISGTAGAATPIGWWKFDEPAGSATAADSSGNNRTGTLTNMNGDFAPGVFGNALTFSQGYVALPNFPSANLSDWTESAWIKTTDPSAGVIITNRQALLQNSLTLHIGWWAGGAQFNGLPYFSSDNSFTEFGAVGNTTVADGNWHLLTGTRTGNSNSQYKMYVDGVLVATNNISIGLGAQDASANSTEEWRIGFHEGWFSHFNGQLDDVRVYDVALTDAEVMALYQESQGKVTVKDGDWNDPATWDPAGVPDSGVGVFIQHKVTLSSAVPGARAITFRGESSITTSNGPFTIAVGAGGVSIDDKAAATVGDGASKSNAVNLDFGANPAAFIATGNGTLTLNNSVVTTQGLSKAGPGTVVLAGSNTYPGATTITGGMLAVNGTLSPSAITVNNGGTLAGSGSVSAVTVNANGSLAPASLGAGTLTTGALTLNDLANIQLQIGVPFDAVAVNGNLRLGGRFTINASPGFAAGSYKIITFTGTRTDGTTSIINNTPLEPTLDTSVANEVNLAVAAVKVNSIARAGTNPAGAASVDFTVTFSTAVTGVDAADFTLATTGGVAGATVGQVTRVNGAVYTVSANTGTGEGTIRLDLIDDNSIRSTSGLLLGGATVGDGDFVTGEVYDIDKTPPTVTVNQAAAQDDPTQAEPVVFDVVFSEPMADFIPSTLTIGGTAGGSAPTIMPNGGSAYIVAITEFAQEGTVILSIAANAVHDVAGNGNSASTSTDNTVTYDLPITAAVANVTSSTDEGSYNAGETINVSVVFNKAVVVTGTPELALNSAANAKALYASGSGTRTLSFNYVVAPGDTADPLDYSAANSLTLAGGATIQDVIGVDALLALPAPGSAASLAGSKSIVIDTAKSIVVDVTSTASNGIYGTGETLDITIEFNEPVVVTDTPRLLLDTGSYANYSSGSDSDTLTFTYVVQSGDSSDSLKYASVSALELNGGSIQDRAGNDATLTLPALGGAGSLDDNTDIVIDAVSPTIVDVRSTTANGTYSSGASISITIEFDKSVDVTGIPTLDMQTGRAGAIAFFVDGSGTDTLTFGYTPVAGDNTLDLDYASQTALNLGGGSINDLLGNVADLVLPFPATEHSLAANAALVINTVPTVASIAPAFGLVSGGATIVVTGTNLDSSNAKFGGTNGTALTTSPTRLTVASPAHAEGVVDVVVFGPGGQVTVPAAFTYFGAPLINSVTPNKGPVAGGQPVTISGTNFVPGTVVMIAENPATGVTVVNSTTITATTPAHIAGLVNVSVSTPFVQSYTLANGYRYNAAPSLISAPVVTPAILAAQRPVTITVSANDPENDPVTMTFDWGDGTTPSSDNHHTYSAAGTYTVSIILDDGVNHVVAQELVLTVGGPAIAMTISKMAGSVNFAKPNSDSLQVSGTIPSIDAGFTFAGKVLRLDVGGAVMQFTLDAKGKAKSAAGSVALKVKLSKTGTFAGGAAPFQLKYKGALASNWLDEGVDPTKTVTKKQVTFISDLVFGGKLYTSTDLTLLTSKANVSGKFAKSK